MRNAFFEDKYEGRRFAALMSGDGPYILDIHGNCGVALGPSSIANLVPDPVLVGWGRRVAGPEWWIVKYHNQPRVCLEGLSGEAREKLAADFGLPIESGEGRYWDWRTIYELLFKKYQSNQRYDLLWVDMVNEWMTKQ